jgi:hypothetical protein
MLGQPDTVQASLPQTNEVNYFRQGQRFILTSLVSVFINEVNGKRWPRDVATLPPFHCGPLAKPSEGGPHVGCGGGRGIQKHPVG